MKKICLVGIGTGHPDHLTIQAVRALAQAKAFYILEKETERNQDLVKARLELLERHAPGKDHRVRLVRIPARRRGGRALADYQERVSAWRRRKAELLAAAIREDLGEGETGAILAWGDPALYDGHIEILEEIRREGWVDFELEVIPGITSMQVLAARHRIPLNLAGESVLVTTGRRLRELDPAGVETAVVLLDNAQSYRRLGEAELDIYWGAYLGTEDEILVSGEARAVVDQIVQARQEARKRKGWVMETYLLRARNAPRSQEDAP
ncbi:MAG: precorrin-6A synthase (deacetylating) [Anaeromyxobacter sp.]